MTGISDREYREYRDITQERVVYHDILKNVDRPVSNLHLIVPYLVTSSFSVTE